MHYRLIILHGFCALNAATHPSLRTGHLSGHLITLECSSSISVAKEKTGRNFVWVLSGYSNLLRTAWDWPMEEVAGFHPCVKDQNLDSSEEPPLPLYWPDHLHWAPSIPNNVVKRFHHFGVMNL